MNTAIIKGILEALKKLFFCSFFLMHFFPLEQLPVYVLEYSLITCVLIKLSFIQGEMSDYRHDSPHNGNKKGIFILVF